MRHSQGVNSEIGRLRTALLHRPGAELRRVTPRTRERLGVARLPWAGRAQEEHDALAQALRDRGVDVLYLTELLQDVLEYGPAREEAIGSVLADPALGERLRTDVRSHLEDLDPEELTRVLVTGLTAEEFRGGRGLVYGLLDRRDFVIAPLPHLVYTQDASVWIGNLAALAARRRERALAAVLFRRHPRFAGSTAVYDPGEELLDGGDVLLLGPGVVAAGVGRSTSAAGVEGLARRLFADGLARTVLAVPLDGPAARLSTVCTMLDSATVLMVPGLAYTLRAHTVTAGAGGLTVSRAQPFLEAVARALGADGLRVLATGLEPSAGAAQQWDDGSDSLAIAPRVLVCYERNTETSARLEAAGVEVIGVPGGELCGGPRSLVRAVSRDPISPAGPGQPSVSRAVTTTVADSTPGESAVSLPEPMVVGAADR